MEELLSAHLSASRIGIQIELLCAPAPGIEKAIIALIKNITNPQLLSSPANASTLKLFRGDMSLSLSSVLLKFDNVRAESQERADSNSLYALFYTYMLKIGSLKPESGCLRSLSERALSNLLDSNTASNQIIYMLEEGKLGKKINLSSRGWTREVNSSVLKAIAEEITALVEESISPSIFGKWLEFLLTRLSSHQVHQYALVVKAIANSDLVDILNRMKTLGTSGMQGLMGSLRAVDNNTTATLFREPLREWRKAKIQKFPVSYLETLKVQGDQAAKGGRIDEAIMHYEMVNLISFPSSVMLQSLTNSAALRLKLSSKQPKQIPIIVLECTRALEIDPNHVKALFRRGLGLALAKKWDKAIVDFERAVELDPNSPAKKELEVARRQITRIIGD